MSIRLFRNAFRDLMRLRFGPPMNPSLQLAGGVPLQPTFEDVDDVDEAATSDSFWFAAPKRKVSKYAHNEMYNTY